MASIFGGSLRLALKQSLAETGHLALPSKPSKKDRSKKHKRSKTKKRRPPPPPSSDEEYESEANDEASSSDDRSISSPEQELSDGINDSFTTSSHNYETRDGSKRRSTLKTKRKRKGAGSKKTSSKAVTVPPPSPEILSWVRKMPESHQKLSIAIGMRVKVRFDTGRKKKDRNGASRRYFWYGGSVADVLKNGKRVRIVYDDGTKEISSFPDNDIVVDDKENGTHQVSADAFIPQHSSDEDDISDDSSALSDRSEVRDENNENDSKSNDDKQVENASTAKDGSVANINPIIVSSPPSNKVSTVTESSFSHPSSSSAGNNDSCESSYSDCTNEYQLSGKSRSNLADIPSNVSAPRITLSTSQAFQKNSKETEPRKSSKSDKKNTRPKTAPSLTIKLIPPKKSLRTKNRSDENEQSVDLSSSSAEENSNSVPKSLRISVPNKVNRPSKKLKRQRQTSVGSKNNDHVQIDLHTDTGKNDKTIDGEFNMKSIKKSRKPRNKLSKFRNGNKGISSSDEDSIVDHHELKNINRNNLMAKSDFQQNTSQNLYVDSEGRELSSDDNSGSLSTFDNEKTISSCEKDTKGSSIRSAPSAESTTPDETISKLDTSPSQNSSPAHSVESDSNSIQMNGSGQMSTSSQNKEARSSRTGRRAAQKANERIIAKENIVVDQYAAPKKRRERINLDLLPLPGDTQQATKSKRIKSFNRNSAESTEVEKDPWVQCDRCHKWRHLPSSVQMDELPERWYCEFNTYDLLRNTCDEPEQSLEEVVMEKALTSKNNNSTVDIKNENNILSLNQNKRALSPVNESSNNKDDSGRVQSPFVLNNGIPSNICVETKPSNDDEFLSEKHSFKMHPKKRGRAKIRGIASASRREDSTANLTSGISLNKMEPSEKREENENELSSNDSFENEDTSDNEKASILSPKRVATNQAKSPEKEEDNQEWVQCDKCKKWRTLPLRVSADDLPETWYCELNTWDTRYASCEIDEVKVELSVRGNSITNNTASQMDINANPDKLSYRNLIFGTGRKLYRPTSERARAADSLFAYHDTEDESSNYPKFMYAESSVFCAKPSRNYECFKHRGFLDTMNTSMVWNELNDINSAPPLIQMDSFGERSILNVKFRRKLHVPNDSDAFHQDSILEVLSNKTLGIHEILFELNSIQCDFTFEDILQDLHTLYLDDCIEIVDKIQANGNNKSHVLTVSNDYVAGTFDSRLSKYKKPWKNAKNKHCGFTEDSVSAEVSDFHTP